MTAQVCDLLVPRQGHSWEHFRECLAAKDGKIQVRKFPIPGRRYVVLYSVGRAS